MYRYLTFKNIMNFVLFLQAFIIFINDTYNFNENVEKVVSVLLFTLGYFTNMNRKEL